MDFKEFALIHKKNQERALADFKSDYDLVVSLFDKMQLLINKYAIRFEMGIGSNRHLDIILSTLVKSMNNMETVIELTINGDIGSARIIIRNIFEFLVMGKYMILYDDQAVREKWDKIEYINIDRKIFKNAVYPDNKSKTAFVNWWERLCQYSHATRASGQVSYDYEDIKSDIRLNFTFMLMLFSMLYHYMNSFLATPYFKNYIQSIAQSQPDNENLNNVIKYQEFLCCAFKEMKSIFSGECKDILNFYSAKWRVVSSSLIEKVDLKESPNPNKLQLHKMHTTDNQCILSSKLDIQKYICAFIQLYSVPHEGVNDTYRNIILKYFKKLKKALIEHSVCEIEDNWYKHHYVIDIKNDSIKLVLCKTPLFELVDTTKDDCFSFIEVTDLLIIKSEFLTVDQFAKSYNVSIRTVKKWISQVKLHSARKTDDTWIIPELQPRPERGWYRVQYYWNSLPPRILKEYPYLKNSNDIAIVKNTNENTYCCLLVGKKQVIISEKERIELELNLLKYAEGLEDIGAVLVPVI